MNDNYAIRPFIATDVWAYKAMRLEALLYDPGMFGNSHALETTFTDQQWMDRVSNPLSCCFGLYYNDELIGITSIIVTDKNKPVDAYMTQSYIRKPYRGNGLSRMLYDARIAWAAAHNIKRLLIGHRAGNIISKAANQHYGFVYSYSEPRTWPDGTTEDMLYYQLLL
ncbi:hypothetical protein CJD36_005525 [Flavipsychrobacter stenotrophus]|uniref:N-acetyltransferase domain-containing protein n=1 Tax=Flavipsychrobacter stenotrophus TaxID=2077091 RepID=A0A2S7SXE3_9BACT|nr:GNAT family N-acetyltransferase [Flavipsychrobacter stenotrophus]PQJ11265.1 hypothetical protein CJD36_005525 [Flavipsychrobacter stenotrophus]